MNAKLASIHSTSEINIFQKLTGDGNLGDFWIGGTRAADTTKFVWVDKSKFDFEKWRYTRPSGDGSCITARVDQTWNDTPCKGKMPYICEKSLLGT